MAVIRLPLIVGTAGGTPRDAAPQRLYNLYPMVDPLAKTGVAWKNTPGWEEYEVAGLPNNTITNGIVFKKNLYVIVGGAVVQITQNRNQSVVGNIIITQGRVHMSQDGIEMIITNGANMYRYDGTTFSEITLPFASPTGVKFHGGHFVCISAGTGRFYISDKFDGSTWNALQFATAEDKPDDILALASDRELLIFGTETTQIYNQVGGLFPFAPNYQGRMVYGIAGDTQALVDNTSFWLARNEAGGVRVMRLNGLTPEPVSSPFIDNELSLMNYDDAFAKSIMWQGREWYVLTFPTDKRTFVFDSQGVWFEWGDYDANLGRFVAHPMLDYVYFNNKHLFMDGSNTIKEFKPDVYKHGDKVMSSMFVSGVQHSNERRLFLNSVLLDMRTGVGGSAEMAVSYDGGYSFGSWLPVELGKVGDFAHRVQWHRLGSGYNFVIRVRITDEVPREFVNGIIEIDMAQTDAERRQQFRLNNQNG